MQRTTQTAFTRNNATSDSARANASVRRLATTTPPHPALKQAHPGNQLLLRQLSRTAPVLQRETPAPDAAKKPAAPSAPAGPAPSPTPDASQNNEAKLVIPWDDILKGKTKLTSMLLSQMQPPAAGDPAAPAAASGPVAGAGASPAPAPAAAAPAGGGPSAPSRLSLKDWGQLSLGLRLGFPKTSDPAGSPSALQQSLQMGEIINYSFTGKVPTAYQVDKGQLVGVLWSLFSTYAAPDLARKIAAGMAGKAGGGGLSYEFDGVLLPDFSGAGLSFTLRFGGGKAPASAAPDPAPVQRKLKVGSSNDPLEAEADRAAEHVMRMPDSAAAGMVQRKCAACEDDVMLNKKSAAPSQSAGEAPPAVHEALAVPGQPLDSTARKFFEPRFGVDLSGVRIHEGPHAARSAEAVGALAYTVGNDIVFNAGRFQPGSAQGNRLLAHELAHTVQQAGESVRRLGDPDVDAAEPLKGPNVAQRPTSSAFWSGYQTVNYVSMQKLDVWKFIGGSVARMFSTENTCATRMSYGLNHGGFPIPYFNNTDSFHNDPKAEFNGKYGDDMNYIVGAPAMDTFFKKKFGPPDQTIKQLDELTAFQATLTADQVAVFACAGHTGILKGSGYKDPYVEIELPIDVWKLT